MSDFEDFVEYVLDNPYDYDYLLRRYPRDISNTEHSKKLPSRKTFADRQRLKRKNFEKRKQQTSQNIPESAKIKQEENKEQRLQREVDQNNVNQENGKLSKEPTKQLSGVDNNELLQSQNDVQNRIKIRNLQSRTRFKRKNIIEELRKNMEEIRKKYNSLETKYNRQQKKIDKLEEICKHLKSELNSLKLQNNADNTECVGMSDIEMEYTSTTVKVEEEVIEEDPIGIGSECNTVIDYKTEEDSDKVEKESRCVTSHCKTNI